MQFYAARDDGEVFGPFNDKEEATMWLAATMANDPDSLEPHAKDAGELVRQWEAAYASDSYEQWQREVLDLADRLDWNLYGIEFVLGDQLQLFDKRLHFEGEYEDEMAILRKSGLSRGQP